MAICFFWVLLANAESESGEEVPRVVAITSRPYVLKQELSVYYAYLPLSHFNHFEFTGASYTHYFNDFFGWEVINAAAARSNPTGLESRLVNDFGVQADFQEDTFKAVFSTSLVYTPIYLKHQVHQKGIRYGDTSFNLGAGRANLERFGFTNFVSFGFSNRFVGREGFNLKLDLRYLQPLSDLVKANLAIGLVLSYNFAQVSNKEILIPEE